jgi:hypothetical protein
MLFRWDLDRTYLDTDIGTFRGLLRAAIEAARDKTAILGAPELARGLMEGTPGARLRFVSGSPEQLRTRLTEKLRADGLTVDRIVLKDNLGNLRRGRLRAVRAQFAYKLGVLVRERAEERPVVEMLFGDDREADPAVYALYSALVDGLVDGDALGRALRSDGAEPDDVAATLRAFQRWQPGPGVAAAWIRLDRRTPPASFAGLGPVIRTVHAWAQAAPALWHDGHLSRAHAFRLLDATVAGVGGAGAAGLLQDAVRRGICGRGSVEELLRDAGAPWADQALRAIALLPPEVAAPTQQPFDGAAPSAWLARRRPALAARRGSG